MKLSLEAINGPKSEQNLKKRQISARPRTKTAKRGMNIKETVDIYFNDGK